MLAAHGMAVKFSTGSHPFYAALGARLGLHDLVSTVVLVGLVCAALRNRRRTAFHTACMVPTVLLVLPPVVSRLPLRGFFHSGEFLVILLALPIATGEPRGRGPLLFLVGVQLIHVPLFETIGASRAWADAFARYGELPATPFALAAAAATAAPLVLS